MELHEYNQKTFNFQNDETNLSLTALRNQTIKRFLKPRDLNTTKIKAKKYRKICKLSSRCFVNWWTRVERYMCYFTFQNCSYKTIKHLPENKLKWSMKIYLLKFSNMICAGWNMQKLWLIQDFLIDIIRET